MAIKNKSQAQKIAGYSTDERSPNDFYETPAIAVEKLLEVEQFGNNILEPCCGAGAISKILLSKGYNVISRDLYDYGFGETGINFLFDETIQPLLDVDAIITNPPYNLSLEFMKQALRSTKKNRGKVAFLLRLAWLEGQERKQFFEANPISKVLVFSKRLPRMHKPGYTGKESTSMMAMAWFIFDWKYSGSPIIQWI